MKAAPTAFTGGTTWRVFRARSFSPDRKGLFAWMRVG